MKKFLLALALLLSAAFGTHAAFAQAVPYSIRIEQVEPGGQFFFGRYFYPSASTTYFMMVDGNTSQPKVGALGSAFTWDGTTLDVAAAQADWNATSGYAQILNKPAVQAIQRTRALTNTSGAYTWTFPNAYGSGVVPIVDIAVEDATSATWNHQITAISNTSVTVQLQKTTAVTVLGVSVLGVAATPQAYIHLTAVAP